MANKGIITLDGKKYVLAGPIERSVINPYGFATAFPGSGRVNLNNYLPVKHLEITPPWSIGRQRIHVDGFVWDEENVNCMFPGMFTLGPLKQSPTWSGGPTTFKAQGNGFAVANNTLFMFGVGASSNDEALWFLNTATMTWTSCTLNSSVAADVVTIVDVQYLNGTYYAIGDRLLSNGTWNRIAYKSTNKTTWSEFHTSADAEQLPTGSDRAAFLDVVYSSGAIYLNSITYSSSTFVIRNCSWSATGFTTSFTKRSGGTTSSFDDISADAAPRGFLSYFDSAGTLDYFMSTNRGLYWYDLSASVWTLLIVFQNPGGSYTGKMVIGPDQRIYYADGPNLGRGWWDGTTFLREYLGPETEPSSGTTEWDGLVAAKQGDITCLAASQTKPWIYVGKGGDTSSRNATIMVYNIKEKKRWNIPYKNGTAQRLITAMIEFNNQLHIMEEQAAGGTQSPFYFDSINLNPVNVSGYKYAASGVVTLSRFDGGAGVMRKGFYKLRVVGDGLTATEKLTVKFAIDGGSLDAGQDLTTSPGGLWIDGAASTSVGKDGLDVYAEITLARGGTNTLSPKVASLAWVYQTKALKDDATPMFYFKIPISRNPTDIRHYELTPDSVVANLGTSFAKRQLLTLTYRENATTYTHSVEMEPYITQQEPTDEPPGGGGEFKAPIMLTLVERI